MPSIAITANRTFNTPNVYSYFGGVLHRGVVCEQVSISPTGATATFSAPLLSFDSNKGAYYTSEVVVYATEDGQGLGEPLFRGYVDEALSILRGDRVTITARSVWSYLQDIKLATPESYNIATVGGLTTQNSPTAYFLSDNAYTKEHENRIWQPGEIAMYSYGRLDAFWQSRATLKIDSAIPQVQPITQNHYRLSYDEALSRPQLTATEVQESPYPDIIFRSGTTFGQVMDFCAQMAPGTQVFEIFTNAGTDIWLAYPQSFGYIVGTAGRAGEDWRDTGSGITELEVNVENGAMCNRVTARASAASCAVTLFSCTAGINEVLTGLVPDWNLYELNGEVVAPAKGIHGCSAYNYLDGTYELVTTVRQTADAVMLFPNMAKPGEPEYRQGYEHVGRRYRLPNWFNLCEIEQKDDLIIDQRTGASVGIQVFAELATQNGTFDFEDGNGEVPIYYYVWVPITGWEFDSKDKVLTLRDVLITDYIDAASKEIDADAGPRLARIAMTFTYSHPTYTLVADSYIDAGGVINPSLVTAITTGQTFDFEDEDLGYTQITNIGLPLISNYLEKVPMASDHPRVSCFAKVSEEGPVTMTYSPFLLAAKTNDPANVYNANAVLAYVTATGNHEDPISLGMPVAPMVLRDDSARLRHKCRQVQYLKGRKPRRITAEFNQLVKARRGMTLGVANVNYLNAFAGDMIDTVTHDLRAGFTTITTSNQPGDDMVENMVLG